MTQPHSIAAVVVTFNGERWIDACLKSLEASEYPVRTYVVDNGSSDRSCEIVQRDFPRAVLIRSERNEGFGAANNRGIARALREGAEGVFLLNQDATVQPATIGRMSMLHAQRLGQALISPLHLNYEGTAIDPHVGIYFRGKAARLLNDLYFGAPSECYEIPFFPAAGWYLPRPLIERVGGFDPLFHHNGEDIDLCERVGRAGFPVLLDIRSTISHYHGGPEQAAGGSHNEEYWRLLLWLKNPASSLLKAGVCAVREYLLQIVRAVVYLDPRSVLAKSSGLARGLAAIGAVAAHRASEQRDEPYRYLPDRCALKGAERL